MRAPVVFLSYSHDSEAHQLWVLKLATDLRAAAVDAIIDEWDLAVGQDLTLFMQHGISNSDRVILVCSDSYVRKADSGAGGVGYERLIVTEELVRSIDTKKFIPLVRNNSAPQKTPVFLGPRRYIDFSSDSAYSQRLEELLREIHGVPTKPPLGPLPFSGAPPSGTTTARLAGPSGLTPTGQDILAEPWFATHAARAHEGLSRMGRKGAMELRFALHDPINKSQLELLNAVRRSEIHTFGWPIGVVLGNRDEYRPRPVADGIVAEIAIPEHTLSGMSSFDYWALRTNGDFYLLQDLFEDERSKDALFFDTRIVRVTESILFAANLYENLGVSADARMSLGIGHEGLGGRVLTSAGPRHVIPGRSGEDASRAQIVDTLGQLRIRVVEHVRHVTEPLFMLFDFKQFEGGIYEQIVNNFIAGRII